MVVLAALQNALRVTERCLDECKIVIAGAGAAGQAIAKLLLALGAGDIILTDRNGALYAGRQSGMNEYKERLAALTNRERFAGSLADALADADVFIGVSGPNIIPPAALHAMKPRPIVFALANPTPEVDPEGALEVAGVLATGRSDYPNQVNNAVAFPGIFRGLLDARASRITQPMLLAAVHALAATVPDDVLSPELIIPSVFQEGVAGQVAAAVYEAALADARARGEVLPGMGGE